MLSIAFFYWKMGDTKRAVEIGPEMNHKFLTSCVVKCDRYFTQIERCLKKGSTDQSSAATTLEIQLWQELKGNRNLSNRLLIDLLIGFYVKLQQTVLLHNQTSTLTNPYFARPDHLIPSQLTLFYNIHIRLGDLQRYLKQMTASRDYYLKAQQLNPNRGQAYNQLALLCTRDPIHSIFYYCRAVMAIEEPSEISRNNITFAVNKCRSTHALIRVIFPQPDQSITGVTNHSIVDWIKEYQTTWLNVFLLSVYSGNHSSIVDALNDHSRTLLQHDNWIVVINQDRLFTLPALDVFFDYVLSDNTQDQIDLLRLDTRLRLLHQQLTIKANSIGIEAKAPDVALRHDYFLFGLKFLHSAHSQLKFSDRDPPLGDTSDLIVRRLLFKFERINQLLHDKRSELNRLNRKTRNIAMQSILGARKNV